MDAFYAHLREIAMITIGILLLGLTFTGYMTEHEELAKWSQTSFGTIIGGYFGYYMGERAMAKVLSTDKLIVDDKPEDKLDDEKASGTIDK